VKNEKLHKRSDYRKERGFSEENCGDEFPRGKIIGDVSCELPVGATGPFATGALIRAMGAMGVPSCPEGAKPTFPRSASSIFVFRGCPALRPFRPSRRSTERASERD